MKTLSPRQKRESAEMKCKLVKIVVILTVVGLMSAGYVAYAMSEGDNPESGKKDSKREEDQGSVQKLTEIFNLSLPQRDLLAALNTQEERTKAIAAQVKTKTQTLNAAIADPGATLTDVSDLIEEIGALQAQMFSRNMERLFAMKKILTPDEFAKMQELEKQPMSKKPQDRGEKDQGPNQQGSGENNQETDQQQ
jgi:Spy/CpxP family protein refolding chaperone